MALEHGGCLMTAAARWDIPVEEWLDLSTGISPYSWPVPPVPQTCWRRLPEAEDGLDREARRWAGAPRDAGCLPVPGTQAAIQWLPHLREISRVGVPVPGYLEHARCWAQAGHRVTALSPGQVEAALPELDVLVWLNPNNPTGERFDPARLLAWHRCLAERGGWLVVDEAFIDPVPADSLAAETARPGLIVLRSLGKFFGLAGARAGMMLAAPVLCEALAARLGPWPMSHPARWLMGRALADQAWQDAQRRRLRRASQRLKALLAHSALPAAGGTGLFQYCRLEDSGRIFRGLAERGILVRQFDRPPALRFGLPGPQAEWRRLGRALAEISREL